MNIAEEVDYALLMKYTYEVWLLELQEKCKHPNASQTPRASTGNWCKSDDCYWYEFKCHDCEKFWTEPQ